MKHPRKLLGALALVAASAFAIPATGPASPAVPAGPGGVIDAVNRLLRAIDAGDQAELAKVVDDQADNLHDFASDGEDVKEATKPEPAVFYECDAAGNGWRAGSREGFLAGLAQRATKATTRVRAIRANCLSERCSYAMVEFERTFGEGDAATVVPMRATAILRYAPERDTPAFRIYHWHASRAAKAKG